MAAHSSTLAWKILWMEEQGGLPSMGSHRVGHDWCGLAAAANYLYIYIYIYIYIFFKSFKIDYSMHFCHSDILYFHVNDNMNGKKGLKLSLVIDTWINLNYTNQLKSRGKTHQNPKHPNCSGTKYWGNIVILVRGSLKSFIVSFHPLCLRTRDNLQRFLN